MNPFLTLYHWLPVSHWLKGYNRRNFTADCIAAVIVTLLLIPQSLAYAMLAGLPAELGLYASIWPLVLYAVFGSSRTLSVGPVAVASLMTATSVGSVVQQGLAEAVPAAITLSLLSGLMLLLMGLLRLGFMTNFLSHGVVSGFITASGILIAFSQIKHILGVSLHGDTLIEIISGLWSQVPHTHVTTLIVGTSFLIFLFVVRTYSKRWLMCLGLTPYFTQVLVRTLPAVGLVATLVLSITLDFKTQEVALVGNIPSGLPSLTGFVPSLELIFTLMIPAFMIAIIGYVESISVGLTLAAKRRQSIDANQELLGLGAANLASGLSGSFPVTGGFSRSVVNFDAGAETQVASILTAIGIALASIVLTPYLYYLPKAALAATIIVAVLSLVNFSIFKKNWNFSKIDFWAVTVTVVITLLFGVEIGVSAGVFTSFALFIYRGATPHIAEVGLIKGSEHFRNRLRYEVETLPHVLMLRIDESLFFANANVIEERIYHALCKHPGISDVVLVGTAINSIDYSALETLENINQTLIEQSVHLHLCELKGPVMDSLQKTTFIQKLNGQIFFTQFEAFTQLKQHI